MAMTISSLWERFWYVSPIRRATINQIENPLMGGIPFLTLIYLIMAVIFVIHLSVCYRGKQSNRIPGVQDFLLPQEVTWQTWLVIKSLILATVAAGSLFAFRMDYGWYKMWRVDKRVGSSQSVDNNTLRFPRSLAEDIAFKLRSIYDLSEEFKRRLPAIKTASVVVSDRYSKAALQYYLLPITISNTSNYIIVFDRNVSYEPRHHALLRDGVILKNNVMYVFSYRHSYLVFRELERIK
jgi:hypothetical protein